MNFVIGDSPNFFYWILVLAAHFSPPQRALDKILRLLCRCSVAKPKKKKLSKVFLKKIICISMQVGHTFLLGKKYSLPLKANYTSASNRPEALTMGCYGLGLSRILQATLEVTSQGGDTIVWPWAIAPYKVCIIGPKVSNLMRNSKFVITQNLL